MAPLLQADNYTLKNNGLFRSMGSFRRIPRPRVQRLGSWARFAETRQVSPQRHRGTAQKPRRTLSARGARKTFGGFLCASVVNIPLLLVRLSCQEAPALRFMGSFRRIVENRSSNPGAWGRFTATEMTKICQSNQIFGIWHPRSDPPLHGFVSPDSAQGPVHGLVSPEKGMSHHRDTEAQSKSQGGLFPRAARAAFPRWVPLCLCASVVNIVFLLVRRFCQAATGPRSMGSFRRNSHIHRRGPCAWARFPKKGNRTDAPPQSDP